MCLAGERLTDEKGGRGDERGGEERAAGMGGEKTGEHRTGRGGVADRRELCGAATH